MTTEIKTKTDLKSETKLNYIVTLQEEIKNLTEERDAYKKELEKYEKAKWYWKFSFSIRNILK